MKNFSEEEIENKMYEIMKTKIRDSFDAEGLKKYDEERKEFVSWLAENHIDPSHIQDDWLRRKIERFIRYEKEGR